MSTPFAQDWDRLHAELAKAIVGHEDIIDGVLTSLFAGGHVLLEGVPGLGKTLLVRSLSQALSLDFSRIQFTPDLMPADVTGTTVVEEDEKGRRFVFRPGPVFAQILLADEINRATPKTQSAMLEAMQERAVTVGGETRPLGPPFLVMATQNPIEQEGTYPLPEAQLDRFFYKLIVGYSSREELCEILERTTAAEHAEIQPILNTESILAHQTAVRSVSIPDGVRTGMASLVLATHPGREFAPSRIDRYVRLGASPRAGQALSLASKVSALRAGRDAVSADDLRGVVIPAMRHRLVLNFEAQADGVSSDDLLRDILETVPLTQGAAVGTS
ncbi:MAG: AAA family ATPase [Phycisphaerales bacterium]|jgi:MoxR-like ATPase|nr:AAA family ATPase [Phycisphaerales bacterium]